MVEKNTGLMALFKQVPADRFLRIPYELIVHYRLALCKKIVENHNGFISVESSPGKGTSFFIYLPAIPDAKLDTTAIKTFA